LAKSSYPNLLDNHLPFQIDGNFGGTAGIAEMLLQSHAGEIALLPALPRAWREGLIRGVGARGAVEIDLTWSAGKATLAVLRPDLDGPHELRPPRGQRVSLVTEQGRKLPIKVGADGLVSVNMAAGKEYRITFR
jgi:alpha-L-fucosidase 2